MWANLKLPLRFQYQNLADGYVGVAELPGLAAEDLKLELDEHGSLLRISGFRLPKSIESKALRQHILNKLGRPPAGPEEYLKAGHGSFGRINEALRLPKDVDVHSIEASCRNGVLQLTLPRQRQGLRQPSGLRRSPRSAMGAFGPFHGRAYARKSFSAGGW
nr:small heat shock protein sHsp17.7 [Dinophyceae sp.]